MRELIYGRNPVMEALQAKRRQAFGLLIADGVKKDAKINEVLALARQRNVPVSYVPKDQLEKLESNHQGMALEVSGYPYARMDDIYQRAAKQNAPPFVLLLDTLQDPQNLGSLIRSAEAFGVHGLVIPAHQSARVTAAVVSASSGASEHMLIVQANLANVIRELKEHGCWVIGLDHDSRSQTPDRIDFSGPIALVVGSEGQGLRRLVRDSCDLLLRLPMVGQIESLNAAIAGSIALYLAFQARKTIDA